MNHIPAENCKSCRIEDAEHGLTRKEFFFVYQPKLRLQEARLSGFECLLRWKHPSRGILMPASFINIVEDSPLTERFTDYIVTEAAEILANWTLRGYDTLSMAINLPAREIGRPEFAAQLAKLFDTRSIDSHRLQIELTETTNPGSIDALVTAIDALKASGFSVAIDDFGAGCWSLSLLHRLGVDTLKLDRKFMKDIQENSKSKVVVETLIQLAQRLGKQVVIEGVETEAQFAWLRTIAHVDCQGYYISAPIVGEQIDQLVAKHGLLH
ncbi:EAL domain-containing protein [Paraburkholderia susongensis]|uniref:EAL domain, c-di-GMP-specific phosphodiesterase class I (Or its enzymatically inactive variant) n=1 Tax=Paraburkholderia susongensis TaxID=1515439 RepID=A0A1X7M4S4_9BURK|nr:EAL domain-containing protein [Paraburkholderia susongensis]SMG61196.1 EAL domain, c-di-GMP-specific phosphodiesterase class I (or its enzymatically inactive variant) [Paraburkholderia susongensis]